MSNPIGIQPLGYRLDMTEDEARRRIQEMREEAGLEQAEAAGKMRVSQAWVSRREPASKRKTRINLDDAAKLAKAYGWVFISDFVRPDQPSVVDLLRAHDAIAEHRDLLVRLALVLPVLDDPLRETIEGIIKHGEARLPKARRDQR